MTDEWEIRLEERRRCVKLCRKVVHEDRRQLIKVIANMKTGDPVHNAVLDQVIAIIPQEEEEPAAK
jgi:hypothetical protein